MKKKICILYFVLALFMLSSIVHAQETGANSSTKTPPQTTTPATKAEKTAIASKEKAIQDPIAANAKRTPVIINDTASLPLRVLTRPMSTIYSDNSEKTVIESNLPAFQSYFVYTRPQGEARATGSGWYEVGTDEKGTIKGWIKGDDVFEWKQTMCLVFTHPDGRKPVLMFDDEEYLDALTKKEVAARVKDVEGLYVSIDGAAQGIKLAQDFPVLSLEPKMYVDINKQFYLLPILEHKGIKIDGREGRILRIAAVSSSGAKSRESSDIRTNIEAAKELTVETSTHTKKLEDLKVDVVWVVDTTRSMGPFIKSTHEAMRNVSQSVAKNPKLNDKISFGVWGYRDSTTIKDIEYNTKNFTPKLQPLDAFLTTMTQVKETKIDSIDVAEDMFAGIHDAITKTAWSPNSIRIIILVGDAPAHPSGHKWNASGQNEAGLSELLKQNKITLVSMHIKPPRTKKYNKIASKQMAAISTSRANEQLYMEIAGKDVERYAEVSENITSSIIKFVDEATKAAQSGDTKVIEEQNQTPENTASNELPNGKNGKQNMTKSEQNKQALDNAIRAAAVEWLGTQAEAQAPRDIEAWVVDKDLMNSTTQSLEVRVLLNKRQLDSLKTLLDEVVTAGMEAQMSTGDLFTALQSASAVAARNPDMLAKATSLGKSGVIPSFLNGLPYTSQLMDMSDELWASWGPDEQQSFLDGLESKVAAYESIHNTPALWVALNKGDDISEYVAPISLELMP